MMTCPIMNFNAGWFDYSILFGWISRTNVQYELASFQTIACHADLPSSASKDWWTLLECRVVGRWPAMWRTNKNVPKWRKGLLLSSLQLVESKLAMAYFTRPYQCHPPAMDIPFGMSWPARTVSDSLALRSKIPSVCMVSKCIKQSFRLPTCAFRVSHLKGQQSQGNRCIYPALTLGSPCEVSSFAPAPPGGASKNKKFTPFMFKLKVKYQLKRHWTKSSLTKFSMVTHGLPKAPAALMMRPPNLRSN